MSRCYQKLNPQKAKASNQLSPISTNRGQDLPGRSYFATTNKKSLLSSRVDYSKQLNSINQAQSVTQRSSSKLKQANTGQSSSRQDKSFKSALKSRPTTCSPMKKVKFDLDESISEASQIEVPGKSKPDNPSILYSRLKSTFQRRIDFFPVKSSNKKTKALLLSVEAINSL